MFEKNIQFMVDHHLLEPEDEEIYLYGLKNGLIFIGGLLLYLVEAKILNCFLPGICFLGIFYSLRIYAGGLHLKTRMQCLVCSTAIITLCFFMIPIHCIPIICYEVIGSLNLLYIWKSKPISNRKRVLEEEEVDYFKQKINKILIGSMILLAVFKILKKIEMEKAVLLAISLVSVLLILERIRQQKEKKRESICI